MALIRKTRSAEEPHALHAVPAGVSRTVARDADAQRKRARTLAKQQQASERVASASSELSAGINEAASAAEELKRAATQIATGAEEASGAAQESLAAITQVGGAITRQLAAVNQAQHMADGMRKLAGNEVVPYLVELSNNMNEGMDTITTDIIDALGHMQFQDINRQLLEQVESALGNLSEHSAALYALVGGDAPPPPQALRNSWSAGSTVT